MFLIFIIMSSIIAARFILRARVGTTDNMSTRSVFLVLRELQRLQQQAQPDMLLPPA